MSIETDEAVCKLEDSQELRVTRIFIHASTQTDYLDDCHPSAYLNWAGQLDCRLLELKKLVQEQDENSPSVECLKRMIGRASRMKTSLAGRYAEEKHSYLAAFVSWVEGAEEPFDLIVCCPSSRQEARFYLEEAVSSARRANADVLDLSEHFHKPEGFKIGKGVTEREAFENVSFNYDGNLERIRNALIIDDVWVKGTTVGTIVSHFFKKGMRADAAITVFTPLVI